MTAGVLFDLDGTLIDSVVPATAALNSTLIDNGFAPVSGASVRPLFNVGVDAMISEFTDVTPESQMFTLLKESVLQSYAELCASAQLFPGIIEIITELARSNIRWGIVTNARRDHSSNIVKSIDWGGRTPDVFVCRDDVREPKPSPEGLFAAVDLLNCDAADCLYVGDAETDIAAAGAAGMRSVFARYGYGPSVSKNSTWAADFTIGEPDELVDLMKLHGHIANTSEGDPRERLEPVQ